MWVPLQFDDRRIEIERREQCPLLRDSKSLRRTANPDAPVRLTAFEPRRISGLHQHADLVWPSGVNLQRILLAGDVARAVVVNLGDGFEALLESLAERVVPDEVDLLGDRNGLFVLVRSKRGLILAVNRLRGYF